MTILRPTINYGYKVWLIIIGLEQKLCGPIFNIMFNCYVLLKNECRNKTNYKNIRNYNLCKDLQCFGHTKQSETTNKNRTILLNGSQKNGDPYGNKKENDRYIANG